MEPENVMVDESLVNKVREHKHNYAQDFGLAVSVPAQALFNELVENPNQFSLEEKKQIIEAYTSAIECRAFYEGLGLPIQLQLSKLKKKIVPQIQKNADFYATVLANHETFHDRWIISKLRMALNETEDLCLKLQNIEHFDYGKSEPFSLAAEIKSTFSKENTKLGTNGRQLIQIDPDSNFGRFSEVMVNMNQESFRAHFLGNIITNLHDHAFKGYDENKRVFQEKIPVIAEFLIKYRWLTTIPFISSYVNRSLQKSIDKQIESNQTKEKRVRITFLKEEASANVLTILIENNGLAFTGNTDDVFKNGVGANGEGHGIGLYSAKQFLNAYNASIEMISTPDNEYKVCFKVKIPILYDKI